MVKLLVKEEDKTSKYIFTNSDDLNSSLQAFTATLSPQTLLQMISCFNSMFQKYYIHFLTFTTDFFNVVQVNDATLDPSLEGTIMKYFNECSSC